MIGAKNTPISFEVMAPFLNKLSVTVGMVVDPGLVVKVPAVKSTGPTPRMPSIFLNPLLTTATPIDCLGMTKPGSIVTVSFHSDPEKKPDP